MMMGDMQTGHADCMKVVVVHLVLVVSLMEVLVVAGVTHRSIHNQGTPAR